MGRLALAISRASKGNGRNNVLVTKLIQGGPLRKIRLSSRRKARQFVNNTDGLTVADA